MSRIARIVLQHWLGSASHGNVNSFPSWVVWSKRLSDPPNSIAVLAINLADTAQSVSVSYEELVGAGAGGAGDAAGAGAVLVGTDVWSGEAAARVSSGGAWQEHLAQPHASRFLVFAPGASLV